MLAVRPARLEGHTALCCLFDELDEFHRQARPDLFRPFDGPARRLGQVEQWLEGPGSTVLVTDDAGDIVGLAVLLTRPPSAFAGSVPCKVIELDNLVVRADWRGRGIGERLLVETQRWSREQGASHVEVGVHAFNHGARRFYERYGFTRSIDRLMLVA